MSQNKIGYRFWQFWQSLGSSPSEEDLNRIRLALAPVEMVQFLKLPIPDQNHSIRVYRSLEESGATDPDLLKAGLLHDLGKTLHPLRRYERILAVLVRAVFPNKAREWGQGSPRGLRRALVVIEQHPIWGSDLAEKLGCSQRTIWLIRNHEHKEPDPPGSDEDFRLLRMLQTIDDQN